MAELHFVMYVGYQSTNKLYIATAQIELGRQGRKQSVKSPFSANCICVGVCVYGCAGARVWVNATWSELNYDANIFGNFHETPNAGKIKLSPFVGQERGLHKHNL